MTTRMYTLQLSETEALIITLWRRKVKRLLCLPPGWEFVVDANPDRLVAKFYDKDNQPLKTGEMWQNELGMR